MMSRPSRVKTSASESLAGENGTSLEKLGGYIAEMDLDNAADADAAHWLKLSPKMLAGARG